MIAGRLVPLLALLSVVPLPAAVRVWQGSIAIPTYAEGPPDENPVFDYFRPQEGTVYPYTMRNVLTQDRSKKEWRTVEIENEYLHCTVLPDLGGRIYSCIDKLNGHDLFYANPTFKKVLVGLRGAWVAAGTEFNFPVGHSWMSISPVDFATRQNAEGSASILVADTDRVYGMRWQVEMVLRPGSGVLEQHVRLSNPTAIRHRYYWWNDASVEAFDDSRFYLPCHLTTAHSQEDLDTWPVNMHGVDMSRLSNYQQEGVARFAFGCEEGFLGAYSQQNGSGTAHCADSRVEPGKKIFTWGWGAHGMGMSRQYTDNGSQYVELQAGLSQDQETFTFLEPHQAVHFTEYWMPVRGIGGISRVNPDAVVYLERSGQTLNVALQVYRTFPGSKLRIVQGGQAVLQETVNLDPAKNLSRQIPARAGLKYTVEVRDGAGALILSHTEDSYAGVDGAKAKDVQPRQAAKTPTTEAEFLKAGDEDERLRNLLVAYQTIQAGLAKFPRSAALNKAAGRLAVGLNRFEEAVQWLSKGPSDAETHYYLGLAYVQMSYVPRACQEFEAARNDPRFGPAAGFELAQSKALLGDLKAALAELEETLKADAGMPGAGALEVALLRNLKRTGDASQRLEYWLAWDPGDSALRYEATRLGKADEALWRHLAADPDRVLDIATGYVRAGLYRDALDVLGRPYPAVGPLEREPGTVLPQDDPLITYYQGFCHVKLAALARTDFDKASKQSTLYIFPHRTETLRVLKTAVAANPSDGTAHFLLGELYLANGLRNPAVREWQAAYKLGGRFPTLHANLGRLLMEDKDPSALKIFEEGLHADPKNEQVQTGLQKSIEEKKVELASATPKPGLFIDHTPPPAAKPEQMADLALTMLASGRVYDAAGIFKEENFPKEKQSQAVRETFVEVRLGMILEESETQGLRRGSGSDRCDWRRRPESAVQHVWVWGHSENGEDPVSTGRGGRCVRTGEGRAQALEQGGQGGGARAGGGSCVGDAGGGTDRGR